MRLYFSIDAGIAKCLISFFNFIYSFIKKKYTKKGKKEVEDEILSEILASEESEKLVQEKLMITKEDISMLSARRRLSDPSCVFRYDKCLIRSLQNDSYPEVGTKGKLPWYLATLYNVSDEGLEVELSYAIEHYIEIDKNGNWKDIKYEEAIKAVNNHTSSDSLVVNTSIIARIPYSSIRHIKENGDSSITDPHIFCSYNKKEGPFDLVYRVYKHYKSGRNFCIGKDKKIDPYLYNDIKRTINMV